MYTSSDVPTAGRSALDAPPAFPPDRTKPGDDTQSLLGASSVNGDGLGVSADTPTGRALGGVMLMMEGANLVQSVIPGAIPPPILQLIQQLSVTLPEIVRSMQQSQMTGPGGVLTALGQPPAPGAGTPMTGEGMGGGMGGPQMGMGM